MTNHKVHHMKKNKSESFKGCKHCCSDNEKTHFEIFKKLKIPNDDELLQYIFITAISLCDPLTRPKENDVFVFSLNFISDLLMAFSYMKYRLIKILNNIETLNSIRFDLSLYFFSILKFIHQFIIADEETEIRTFNVNNKKNIENLEHITKRIFDDVDVYSLNLLYLVVCMLVIVLNKLFIPICNQNNLILNPYFQYFIKLWKCHTNILLIFINLNDKMEFETQLNDMELNIFSMIFQTLIGLCTIRYVLSSILNQSSYIFDERKREIFLTTRENEIKNKSLINLLNPLINKNINGSLIIERKNLLIQLIVINLDFSFITNNECSKNNVDILDDEFVRIYLSELDIEMYNIILDIEFNDILDYQIRKIFKSIHNDKKKLSDFDFKYNKQMVLTKNQNELSKKILDTIKIKDLKTFCYEIWNDKSMKFLNFFLKTINEFDLSWKNLKCAFDFLLINSIDENNDLELKVGKYLINLVSISLKINSNDHDDCITSEKIYKYWTSIASNEAICKTIENNVMIVSVLSITNFELFLYNNNELSKLLMDEMLICQKYRQKTIWFLTHNINLLATLIDYIFELVSGYRENLNQSPYFFSKKKKKIILDEKEKLTLLHDFLTNCNIYLSLSNNSNNNNDSNDILSESLAKKIVSLLCLMINQLIKNKTINLYENNSENFDETYNYKNEIQVLFVNWIGKSSDVRKLFFATTNNKNLQNVSDTKIKKISKINNVKKNYEDLFKYYKKLDSLEITKDIVNIKKHYLIINDFTLKLKKNLNFLLKINDLNENEKKLCYNDFAYFFSNFYELSKINQITDLLFQNFKFVFSFKTFNDKKIVLYNQNDNLQKKEY